MKPFQFEGRPSPKHGPVRTTVNLFKRVFDRLNGVTDRVTLLERRLDRLERDNAGR